MNHARALAEARNTALMERVDSGLVDRITVQTKYGDLTGLVLNKSTQFLGVPFATPPVGNLRWCVLGRLCDHLVPHSTSAGILRRRTSPVAPSPWGSYNATRYRDICVQNHPSGWDLLTPGESEDCLYMVGPALRAHAIGFRVSTLLCHERNPCPVTCRRISTSPAAATTRRLPGATR